MNYLFKIMPAIIFWGVFIYIVLTIPYPQSLTQANMSQIIPFFAALYLAILLTLNIFLKRIILSASVTLGIILLLLLKALDSLNLVTGLLVIITIGLFASYFMKIKKRGLTKSTKIPKLTKL